MDARELRIGNFINYNYLGSTIVSMIESGEDITQASSNEYSPIPLTEEWIAKLGISNNGRNIYSKHGEIDICVNAKVVYIGGCDLPLDNQYFELKCEYVHQLQNLYFSLTGQELTIKQ